MAMSRPTSHSVSSVCFPNVCSCPACHLSHCQGERGLQRRGHAPLPPGDVLGSAHLGPRPAPLLCPCAGTAWPSLGATEEGAGGRALSPGANRPALEHKCPAHGHQQDRERGPRPWSSSGGGDNVKGHPGCGWRCQGRRSPGRHLQSVSLGWLDSAHASWQLQT